jgi:16S rRNA (uracil1498-N3)-methyltransferase
MHSFFIRKENISGESITISDSAEAHHLRDVLRIKVREEVAVFDEEGDKYICSVESIGDQIYLQIKERHGSCAFSRGSAVTVACAIPKNSKFDDIIDKLVQLGVARIIPLLTERVVVRLNKDKQASRLKRWEKIALSAAKQSHSPHLAVITPVKNIKEVLGESAGYDLKLIPTLGQSKRRTLRAALGNKRPQNILVLIGPEGDFTDEEIGLAQKKGFITVTLGELVLRVETAAIAVAGFIRFYLYEDR